MSLNGWVFFHGASHYEMKSLHLYKAGKFPYDWLCCKTLLSGFDIRDALIFHSDVRWWIFADTNPTASCDRLNLFYAKDLMAHGMNTRRVRSLGKTRALGARAVESFPSRDA
jgi:hypothetical protein